MCHHCLQAIIAHNQEDIELYAAAVDHFHKQKIVLGYEM